MGVYLDDALPISEESSGEISTSPRPLGLFRPHSDTTTTPEADMSDPSQGKPSLPVPSTATFWARLRRRLAKILTVMSECAVPTSAEWFAAGAVLSEVYPFIATARHQGMAVPAAPAGAEYAGECDVELLTPCDGFCSLYCTEPSWAPLRP